MAAETEPRQRATQQLQKTLGHAFADRRLLEQALTHRSAGARNYERLEFLGDGLLNFVIGAALYRALPDAEEGDLSRLRASLVRESTLAEIARELQLAEVIGLGPGELRSGGFRRKSIQADIVESLIGAAYLDAGFAAAEAMVLKLFKGRLASLPDPKSLKDAKTQLQEILQGQSRPLPEYETVRSEGPPHKQVFTVRCRLNDSDDERLATGASRRKAEQNAARAVIDALFPEAGA